MPNAQELPLSPWPAENSAADTGTAVRPQTQRPELEAEVCLWGISRRQDLDYMASNGRIIDELERI